jgi:hypothetical protein
MKTFTPFILLFTQLSCKNSKDFKSDFNKHKFDQAVINNMPQYDTLRQLVLNNYDSFDLNSTKNDFTFIYNFDTTIQISKGGKNDVPEMIYSKIVQLFNEIGKENIFGFTLSKDSTFKILVRNIHLTKYFLDVRERLYWYPDRGKIAKTEFPFKDTLITDKWQYQIYYDKRSEF